ncbi:MAG: MBL fold metallo-hydrolase, partial [Solirubrobacterales bacterium]|nr:MBL fold metallo-hydrolase [Solirubrobacterales bacterium]
MILKQYYLGCLAHASYLIADEDTGSAAVVDPQRDVEQYVADARRIGCHIRHVFLTHFHADFLAGHLELRDREGAEIHLGARARAEYPFTPMADGSTVRMGGVRLVVHSLHEQFARLPDETLAYPAHGAGSLCGRNLSTDTVSTIGTQRLFNYALQPMSRERFIELVTAGLPDAPSYFTYDAVLNTRERPTLAQALKCELTALSVEQVLDLEAHGAQLLDTREPAQFAGAHLRGSVNVGLSGSYATWCGTLLDCDRPIVLISEPGRELESATRLGRIGFDRVAGYLAGGMEPLDGRPELIQRTHRITAGSLAEQLESRRPPTLLDAAHAPGMAGRPHQPRDQRSALSPARAPSLPVARPRRGRVLRKRLSLVDRGQAPVAVGPARCERSHRRPGRLERSPPPHHYRPTLAERGERKRPMTTIELEPVDRIQVTILIDNVTDPLLADHERVARVNWGRAFSGALPRAASRVSPDHGVPDALIAEPGFSALVRLGKGERERTLLFDTGVSPGGMLENMRRLGISPQEIEVIVLSHGHWDHVTGIEGLVSRLGRAQLPVMIHPEFWNRRRIRFPGLDPAELPATSRLALEGMGFEIVEERHPSFLLDHSALVTGEVDRTTEFETGLQGHDALRGANWTPDPLVLDDQALVVRVRDEGLLVLSGCGHAGIVNTVRYAQKLTGEQRIAAVIGGFHLSGPMFESIIEPTVAALGSLAPSLLAPAHCTGWKAVH